MKRWNVTIKCYRGIEVEAATEDKARKKAREELEEGELICEHIEEIKPLSPEMKKRIAMVSSRWRGQ